MKLEKLLALGFSLPKIILCIALALCLVVDNLVVSGQIFSTHTFDFEEATSGKYSGSSAWAYDKVSGGIAGNETSLLKFDPAVRNTYITYFKMPDSQDGKYALDYESEYEITFKYYSEGIGSGEIGDFMIRDNTSLLASITLDIDKTKGTNGEWKIATVTFKPANENTELYFGLKVWGQYSKVLIYFDDFIVTANAGTSYTSGYYTYTVSNGEVTITDVNTSISGNVTIPSKLGGYPVTSIRDYAFLDCTNLESITIPNSVADIGSTVFSGCTSLKEVVLPETTEIISSNAFQNCTALEKVYIPQSVKTLGSSAFTGCDLLSDITFADYSITKIDSNTFKDCPAVEKIVLPKGLTTISSQAFMNCTSLAEVTIPQSVTSIDSTAFSYPDKTTIYGVAGSYAETFANNGGFKFVDIGVESEGLALSDFAEYVVMDRGETYRAEFITYPEETTDIIALAASNNNVTISGLDIYARNTGDTLITATTSSGITYEFTVHVRDVSKITITTLPTKTEYVIGEKLNTDGMVITVNYNDGTTKEVTDYTVSGFDSSVEGTSTVTVKWVSAYGTTYSATFTTTIPNPIPELTGIYVEKMPFRTLYNSGVKLDLSGLVIMGTYTDGSVKEITEYTSSKINVLKLGAQTVTITSGEFTCNFNVTVVNCTSHIEGEWEITIKPTEETTGERCKRCTVCQTVLATETMEKLSAGDLNGDGEIDVKDLVRIKKILSKTAESTGTSSDIDGSGTTDSVDLSILRKFLLGIVSEFIYK